MTVTTAKRDKKEWSGGWKIRLPTCSMQSKKKGTMKLSPAGRRLEGKVSRPRRKTKVTNCKSSSTQQKSSSRFGTQSANRIDNTTKQSDRTNATNFTDLTDPAFHEDSSAESQQHVTELADSDGDYYVDEEEQEKNTNNNTDVDTTDGTSPSNEVLAGWEDMEENLKVKYSKLISKVVADETARELTKPILKKVHKILMDNHMVFDPCGPISMDLIGPKISNGGGVCAIRYKTEEGTYEVFYIGETSVFCDREQRHMANSGIRQGQFCVVVDMNNLTQEASDQMQPVYKEYMEVMSTSCDLSKFQHILFIMMVDDEGDRLGPESSYWRQLFDSAMQTCHYALPETKSKQEFLMYDQAVESKLYELSKTQAQASLDRIKLFLEATNRPILAHACMSFKPEIDGLSAKVEATKCLVKGPVPDVIYPPVPGATAVEDRYGVSKYKAKDHSDARSHIRSILWKGKQHVNAGGRAIVCMA